MQSYWSNLQTPEIRFSERYKPRNIDIFLLRYFDKTISFSVLLLLIQCLLLIPLCIGVLKYGTLLLI